MKTPKRKKSLVGYILKEDFKTPIVSEELRILFYKNQWSKSLIKVRITIEEI